VVHNTQAFQRYQFLNLNSSASVASTSAFLLGILEDLDTLLGSDVNFLLGTWQSAARAYATTPDEVRRALCLHVRVDVVVPTVRTAPSPAARVGVQCSEPADALGYVDHTPMCEGACVNCSRWSAVCVAGLYTDLSDYAAKVCAQGCRSAVAPRDACAVPWCSIGTD
jgi:hypothetical protein